MKIAIGCDHGGFVLKQHIIEYLTDKGYQAVDYGSDGADASDYPIFAKKVTSAILSGECELGILICGTGIGMSIAANKVDGIRAAVCGETFSARMARAHNNANILTIGARVIGPSLAEVIVGEFVSTTFEGGRHARRVALYDNMNKI